MRSLIFITVLTIICCSGVYLNAGPLGESRSLLGSGNKNTGEIHTFIWYNGKESQCSQMRRAVIEEDGTKVKKEIYVPVDVGLWVKCDHVRDGDTIVVDFISDNQTAIKVPVRYIGIDTPERGETGWQEAQWVNSELTSGRMLYLFFGADLTDQYNRLLAYVINDEGVFINAALAAKKLAQAKCYQPNCLFYPCFDSLWNWVNKWSGHQEGE